MSLSYVGTELELFGRAVNWKQYWADQVRPYVRGEVLEVRIASTTPSRLDPGEKGRFTMTKPALVGIQASRTTLPGR